MTPPMEWNEARWRLLKRLAAAEEGTCKELVQAVMPPYRDATTPRLLLASLVSCDVAAVGRRDRRGAVTYVITEKGRAAVAAGKPGEVFK